MYRFVTQTLLLLFAAAGLTGCATNVLPMYDIHQQAVEQAAQKALRTTLPPARMAPVADLLPILQRVQDRMWPAALTVCKETFSHGCEESLASMKPYVITDDPTINAFAREDGALLFNAGLMQVAGKDDEIAAVMGHEIAHVMLGHISKRKKNENLGAALGLLLGLGLAVETAPYLEADDLAQVMQASTETFAHIGDVSYSKEMELEADTLAVHMVQQAGYDLDAAKSVLIRFFRIGEAVGAERARGLVGFLSTHPSDGRRLAHWDIVAHRATHGLTPRQ